jgi:hypothetical protein
MTRRSKKDYAMVYSTRGLQHARPGRGLPQLCLQGLATVGNQRLLLNYLEPILSLHGDLGVREGCQKFTQSRLRWCGGGGGACWCWAFGLGYVWLSVCNSYVCMVMSRSRLLLFWLLGWLLLDELLLMFTIYQVFRDLLK